MRIRFLNLSLIYGLPQWICNVFFCLHSPVSGVWWGLAGCLESCAILRLCSRVGETTAWGCSRSRFRDSAIPADVFWKGDRLSQAGPGPVPRTGAGWTSAVLVQGRRSCETALPTLAAVCGRTQGPGAKGRASPVLCLGFTSPLGACSIQGELLVPGACELSPHRAWADLCQGTSFAEHLSGAGGLSQPSPSPGASFPLQFLNTVWVPAALISISPVFQQVSLPPFAPLPGVGGPGSEDLRGGERHGSCGMDLMSSIQGMFAKVSLYL